MIARTLFALLLIALVVPSAASDDARTIEWSHEGFGAIHDAAVEARTRNRRLLIGVSGGGT